MFIVCDQSATQMLTRFTGASMNLFALIRDQGNICSLQWWHIQNIQWRILKETRWKPRYHRYNQVVVLLWCELCPIPGYAISNIKTKIGAKTSSISSIQEQRSGYSGQMSSSWHLEPEDTFEVVMGFEFWGKFCQQNAAAGVEFACCRLYTLHSFPEITRTARTWHIHRPIWIFSL